MSRCKWKTDELFKKKLGHAYEKRQTTEPFYEPLKLGRKDYFSSLGQYCLGFQETKTTQGMVLKIK